MHTKNLEKKCAYVIFEKIKTNKNAFFLVKILVAVSVIFLGKSNRGGQRHYFGAKVLVAVSSIF